MNEPTMATESALVVAVPNAEPVVGQLRRLYDPAATWGVPAHITVLYPFVAPDQIDNTVMTSLGDVFGRFEPFDFNLASVDQFGSEVLYILPDPTDRFVALTSAVTAAWPDYPPYEGAHDEVIPHLTVAHTGQGASFDAIRARVRSELPIQCRMESVDLMVGNMQPGSWHTVATFGLA
ncbi:MAG: 2'-5' RNA ligase family protein [Acidimicrobiia bacterium]|nr:2'-5' RNA ligase family protein [Acidimicrobiia bacterium]